MTTGAWLTLYFVAAALTYCYLVRQWSRNELKYRGDLFFFFLCAVFWPMILPLIVYGKLKRGR